MFGKLKNLFGGDSGIEITAPVAGKVVALEDVPDPTFAQGILGPGIAIEPTEGRIVAPADGTLVDEKKIKAAGVAGVMRPSQTAVQVIIGTKVQFVADEMAKML